MDEPPVKKTYICCFSYTCDDVFFSYFAKTKLTSARKYDVFSELFSVGIAGGADSLCCFSVTI